MSVQSPPERVALDPGGRDETRAERARSEPMAVVPIGGGCYDVVSGADQVYTVDLVDGRCTCADYRYRRARCKHLRRVAIDVTERRVPAPGQRAATCGDCGRRVFVEETRPDPVYCEDCDLVTGDFVRDREAGTLLVVVRPTTRRADEVSVPGREQTVAEYAGNEAYDPADPVVEVVYPLPAGLDPDELRDHHLRRYSFPRGRLERLGPDRETSETGSENASISEFAT